jgi:hypothetical protein
MRVAAGPLRLDRVTEHRRRAPVESCPRISLPVEPSHERLPLQKGQGL